MLMQSELFRNAFHVADLVQLITHVHNFRLMHFMLPHRKMLTITPLLILTVSQNEQHSK